MLRLKPQNFVIISEILAANLEKVKGSLLYDKQFQSFDLFDFDIFLFALLTRVSPRGKIKKTGKVPIKVCINSINSLKDMT